MLSISALIHDFAANFRRFFYRIRDKCGKSRKQLDIDQLRDFVDVHSLEPEDEKTPYIVAHTIEELQECEDGQRFYINILISSKTLINRILKDPTDKVIMIDTTHGLSVDRLLLCLTGTTNSSHAFCPIALSLTTNENTRSAAEVLQWVKDRHEGKVQAVMADGALCLSSAISAVFGDSVTRLMCLSHMMR